MNLVRLAFFELNPKMSIEIMVSYGKGTYYFQIVLKKTDIQRTIRQTKKKPAISWLRVWKC